MKKTLKMMAVAAMLAFTPAQASAGDYEVQNVLDDAMYGAGIGFMVGAGLMLISDVPTDNWDFLTKGLGYGMIGGAAYGVFRSAQSFARVEDGQIHLGVPSPEFAFQETTAGLDLVMKTNLISGTF
ncbi:MAG: hypothetical protein Q9M19_00230 [Mariprofundaceae bacterium]|nr:hypothetical protein [Mariprofundaceae bacterium]